MSKSDNLIKNTAILAVGTICTKVLAFIIIPIFSRWLSVDDYGLFDLYGTYITLLLPVLTLSCGEAVFRFLIDTTGSKEKKRLVSTGLMIVVIGLVIGTVTLGLFFQQTASVKLAVIAYMLAEILNNYLLCFVRGEKKLRLYAETNIITMLFEVVFVTLFVYKLHFGLAGILLGYACAYGASDIYVVVRSRIYQSLSVKESNRDTAKALIKYSFPLIPNTICWWIMNVSDRTIIKWILGTTVLGVYSIACKIPSLCSTLFGVFQLSWQQSVSETINDEGKETFYNNVLNNLIRTIVSIAIGVLSVNFILFDYVFDIKYADAYWQSGILIPATVLSAIGAYLGGIFIGQKDSKSNGATTMVTAAANVVSHLALIKFVGVYAASISTLIGYVLLVIIRWIKVNKNIKLAITKRTWLVLIVFVYFIVIQYFRFRIIEYCNLIIAIVLFCVINKQFIARTINKVIHR